MELGRGGPGGTTQPGRVPLSARTCHQPLTGTWGTHSLPRTPLSPTAGSHMGRMQVHCLQHCPTAH